MHKSFTPSVGCGEFGQNIFYRKFVGIFFKRGFSVLENLLDLKTCLRSMTTVDLAPLLQRLEEQRYALDQTELLAELENFARQQISTPSLYDVECNLHILKSYQLNPTVLNLDIVVGILLKALTRLPETDYLLSTLLLTENVQQDSRVAAVLQLGSQLESARFTDCWETLAESDFPKDVVADFAAALRVFILHVVGNSFKAISKEMLSGFMNLSVDELNILAAEHGWTITVDAYNLPADASAEVTNPNVENIQLSQLLPIISHLT